MPGPECVFVRPTDPWHDSADTTTRDQTERGDRPAHNSSETSRETIGPATGGPQTFFRKASDSLCLSSERSATRRFNRVFTSSSCRRRRSDIVAYFKISRIDAQALIDGASRRCLIDGVEKISKYQLQTPPYPDLIPDDAAPSVVRRFAGCSVRPQKRFLSIRVTRSTRRLDG